MKTGNKRICIALAAVLLLSSGGCSVFRLPENVQPAGTAQPTPSASPTAAVNRADTVFSINYDSTANLNPLNGLTKTNSPAASLIYEGLFALDGDFNLEYVLCTSYSRSEDGKTYTFALRDGVTFQDGTALTAADVKYSLDQARTGAYVARLDDIESITAANALTVVVKLVSVNNLFPYLLDIPIIKNGDISKQNPVGTGPYLFMAEKDYCCLRSYTGWWQGTDKLPLARVYLKEYKPEQLIGAFETGYIDLVVSDAVSSTELGYGGNYETAWYDTTYLQYLGFNPTGLLADASVRQAIGRSIDRTYIAGTIMDGYGDPSALPTLMPYDGLSEIAQKYAYSPQALSALLNERGIYDRNGDGLAEYLSGSVPVTLKLTFIANADNPKKLEAARTIADNLVKLGLNVEFKALGWDDYITALKKGNFDLYYAEVRLRGDFSLDELLSDKGSMNYADAGGKTYSELAQAYMSAADDTRAAAAAALYGYIADTAYIVPVLFRKQAVLTGRGVVTGAAPAEDNPFRAITGWKVMLGK